jgi:hypothetical protein
MKNILALLFAVIISGCAVAPKQDLSAFAASAPKSILVVPTVNRSLDVDAPNYLLSTLPVPIAEKGFYVFPVNTVKLVLEQEGLYEGELVHKQPPAALAKTFGADAVLFVKINRWDAQYALVTTVVTVEFEYHLTNKDGVEIWRATQRMQYSPQTSNAGHPLATIISAAVQAAITRAAPNYLPLTRQANQMVFVLGPNAIPDGPYRKPTGK